MLENDSRNRGVDTWLEDNNENPCCSSVWLDNSGNCGVHERLKNSSINQCYSFAWLENSSENLVVHLCMTVIVVMFCKKSVSGVMTRHSFDAV